MPKTQGELESEFTKEIINLEKEYLGRGPVDARTFFVDDMILVRLRGVLTKAEQTLSENEQGSALIKETRDQLFQTSRPMLENIVRALLDCEVLGFHSDISTKHNERIVVLTVDENLGKRYSAE